MMDDEDCLAKKLEASKMIRLKIEIDEAKKNMVSLSNIRMFELGYNIVKSSYLSYLAMKKIEYSKCYLKGKLYAPLHPDKVLSLRKCKAQEAEFSYSLSGNYVYIQRIDGLPVIINDSNNVYIYTEDRSKDNIQRYWWTVCNGKLIGVTREEDRQAFIVTLYL